MATKKLKLRGTCSYAKMYKPDDFKGKEFWKINLFPDEDSMMKFKKSGLQNKIRTDDGKYSGMTGEYISFRRDCEITRKKKKIRLAPPMIVGPDDDILISYGDWDADNEYFEREGDVILIGNGSVVEIKLEVYDTQMGKGSRLEAVKLIDLIEYIPPEEVDEEEVDDEPAPKVSSAKKTQRGKVPF